MRVSVWLWVVVGFTVVQAVQTAAGLTFIPFTGTMATAALAGYAATRRPVNRLALAGTVVLTAGAAAVDYTYGGFGWPGALGAGSGPIVAILIGAAVLLLGFAAIMRTGPARRLLPTIVAVVVAVVLAVFFLFFGAGEVAGLLLVPLVGLVVAVHASDAAVRPGGRFRPAGLALVPLLVVALATIGATGAFAGVPGFSAPREYCSATTFGNGRSAPPKPAEWRCQATPVDLEDRAVVTAKCDDDTAVAFRAAAQGHLVVAAAKPAGGPAATDLLVDCPDPAADRYAYRWLASTASTETVSWRVNPWNGSPPAWQLLVSVSMLLGFAALTRRLVEP